MTARSLRYAALFGCFMLLLVAQSSATPCANLCTEQACATECAQAGSTCSAVNPAVNCAGRQAYCYFACENGFEFHPACSDTCYTSPGGGSGSGSPVFAHKQPLEPPPS